jgi:hypothetical protein
VTDLRLHPRLPRAFAAKRWDTLQNSTPESARASIGEILPQEVIWTATGPPRISERQLRELREELVEALADLPFGEPLSSAQRETFDRRVTRALARRSGLFPAEAAHTDLWSYYALVLLPDLAIWRWMHMPSPNVERFVGSDLTRHTFGRLWWRAYTFTGGDWDDDAGWALLEALGEADIDQVQSRRRAYGVDPPIVRALAEIYVEVRERAADAGLSAREVWRDLLKRLLRRGAFIAFGALEPEALKAAAREQLEVTLEAVRGRLEAEAPDSPQATPWTSFEEMPFSYFVVAVTKAVDAAGAPTDAELPSAVDATIGVDLPGRFRSLLTGFAYMAEALGFLKRSEHDRRWHLTTTPPAPDRRWGDWTAARIREAAERNGGIDDDLVGMVFTGRPGRTVRRAIRAAAQR